VGSSDSIIPREPFRPFIEDDGRPTRPTAKTSSSFELVDCMGEPAPGELAYWSIQEDKTLWPAEA
jgi:hypothetical protein